MGEVLDADEDCEPVGLSSWILQKLKPCLKHPNCGNLGPSLETKNIAESRRRVQVVRPAANDKQRTQDDHPVTKVEHRTLSQDISRLRKTWYW